VFPLWKPPFPACYASRAASTRRETRGQAPESEGASGHQAGTGKPSPAAQKATVKAPPYAGRADPMQELGKLNISDPVRTLVGLESGKRDYRSRETALRKMPVPVTRRMVGERAVAPTPRTDRPRGRRRHHVPIRVGEGGG
jgi:hypothetical protein